MGGLSTLYVRAARAFVQTLPDEIDAIASDAASAGSQTAARAHTLKGIAATLGANALSQVAAQIEGLVHTGDFGASLQSTVQRLRKAAGEARMALTAAADRLDGKIVVGERDDAEVTGALNTLIRLLENDDLAALAHYAQVKHLLASVAQSELDRLEAALQDLNLGAALAVCRGIQAAV
jgi:HPt (histidine-containing phosphotransfer) domain-containing protein